MATITVHCAGIICENRVEFEIPDWIGVADCEEQQVFCPDCKTQTAWFNAVCPGCVGIYPDCGLGKAFAYSDHPVTITDVELDIIEAGRCPYRVNGSIMIDHGIVSDIDLSKSALTATGHVIRVTIEEYIGMYRMSTSQ